MTLQSRIACLLFLALSWSIEPVAAAQSRDEGQRNAKAAKPGRHAGSHHSVKPQRGKASYYGRKFHGKKMADGTKMNPNSNVAASKTLPLGTKAEVKNLETGKSTVVEVKDRGPYVKDRIIDVSPKVAEQLDMKKEGVVPVEVKPLEVPGQNGGKAGSPGTSGDRGEAR